MKPPELTVTTIRYLYATTWLPGADKEWTVAVPGGKTRALDTAANLLHTALWELRRHGVFDFEQLRPVVQENIEVLGGLSFARLEFRDPGVDLPGLEGGVIDAARKVGAPAGRIGRMTKQMTNDHEWGVRRLVFAMDVYGSCPWLTVTNCCLREAEAAGLVEGGRWWQPEQVRIVDQPAVDSLRERGDELRAARKADMEREPDLHKAIITDGIRALRYARTY